MKAQLTFLLLLLSSPPPALAIDGAAECRTVFVRFIEGTIADPGPADSDAVWLPEDFADEYQGLLTRLEEAGVIRLRPIGISWRNLDADASPRLVDFSTVYVAQLDSTADAGSVAAALGRLAEVEYAEVPGFGVYFDSPESQMGDRYTSVQWWMENTGQSMNCSPPRQCEEDVDSNIPEAWDLCNSSDALVGILDSGVYTNTGSMPRNSYLSRTYNSDLSRDFTGSGMDDIYGEGHQYHGTRLAGIVAGNAAYYGDFEGVVGRLSPSGWYPLVVYRISLGGDIPQENAIEALDFICNPTSPAYGKVRVVSTSWGITNPLAPPTDTLSDAFSNAYESDLVILSAAGNLAYVHHHLPYPAAYIDFSQAVAHVRCDGLRDLWQTGNHIDIAAPGKDIQTVGHESGLYNCFDGTSAATPIAAGIASLMLGYCPSLTNDDVYELMKCTAEDIGPEGYDIYYGHGLVRADAVLEALEAADSTVFLEEVSASSVTWYRSLMMGFKWIPNRLDDGTSWAEVYRVEGVVTLVPSEEGRVIECVWTRGKDCETVRGPADLYELDFVWGNGSIPYFNGRRLANWAAVEHVEGDTYRVYGYVYHLYDNESKQQDRGWFPFNPYLNPPSPMFAVAYIEGESEMKIAVPQGGGREQAALRLAGSHLEFDLSRATRVEVKAYDVAGRLVADFGARTLPAGRGDWEIGLWLRAAGLSSGIYLLRVETPEAVLTGRGVVLR